MGIKQHSETVFLSQMRRYHVINGFVQWHMLYMLRPSQLKEKLCVMSMQE